MCAIKKNKSNIVSKKTVGRITLVFVTEILRDLSVSCVFVACELRDIPRWTTTTRDFFLRSCAPLSQD